MTNTTNYNLKKPATSDYYNVQDQNDNMDTIDAALKPTADPAQAPSGNVGKLAQWVSWLTNRIKAITGGTNWYDAPAISLAQANNLISSHKAETEAHSELADRTIIVGSGRDFTTIQAAINSIKKIVNATININVDPGTYNEDVYVEGFFGRGAIFINGATALASAGSYQVKSFNVKRCGVYMAITGFRATTNREWNGAFDFCESTSSLLSKCDSVSSGTYAYGCTAEKSGYTKVEGCAFSNKHHAITSAEGSSIYSNNNTGSSNTYGLEANTGGVIAKNGTQPSGTTAETVWGGGEIR